MTPEAQRIAIAEARGYPNPRMGEFNRCYAGELPNLEEVPDYLNDLNAMNEAFKTLRLVDQCRWHEELRGVLKRASAHNVDEGSIDWLCDNATASQRAEAFLRTLGLWKE